MATVSKGRTFVSGETVTPAKLNELVDNATVTNIQTADIGDGQVTTAKLASGLSIPAGAVMPFAMNSAPTGWLAANGDAVSRSTYSALFSAIGTTHGSGDGSTTFNLPDLRGYFVRGSGTNADGIASGTFAAKQAASIINHTHSGTTSTDGAHTHTQNAGANVNTGGISNQSATTSNSGGAINVNSAGSHSHSFTTGNPSTGGGTETRPANIALLYCIKF